MGIPLPIFSLYSLRSHDARCRHMLLLKVQQPAFSNADAADYDRVAEIADAKRQALLRAYETGVLAKECAGPHVAELVGEMQAFPAGEAFIDGRGGYDANLWVAETRYGRPWVVMGTAGDEDAFWRAVEADGDLAGLGATRPAVLHRVFYLADDDDEG